MSVVAARKYDNHIGFAADSISVAGSTRITQRIESSAKLFQSNGLTIGGAGSARELSLISLYVRNHNPAAETLDAMIDFIWRFEKWVQERDPDFKADNHYLIAFQDVLFRTYGGLEIFQVNEFDAVGAGQDFAITALHLEKTPMEAVDIACQLSVWCHPPVIELEHVSSSHS